MGGKPHISVVTPVYGNQLDLPALYQRLSKSLQPITSDFEIIMVNDASPDNAWEVIQDLSARDPRVLGVNLSKNFGQHRAITAGLEYAQGDWVVVMDCDLQDRPEEIPNFYQKAQEGFDIVVGSRCNRGDGFFKKQASKWFYKVFNYLTEQNLDNRIANFGIYAAKVITQVRKLKERDRSFGLLVTLVGFRRTKIDVQHDKRVVGSSAYNFTKSMEMAVGHILSHSNKPLRLFINFGFLVSVFSFLFIALLLVRYFIWAVTVPGWTSMMLSVAFLLGTVMMMIGILGLYIGKIYDEVKNRPLYIVDTTTFE